MKLSDRDWFKLYVTLKTRKMRKLEITELTKSSNQKHAKGTSLAAELSQNMVKNKFV